MISDDDVARAAEIVALAGDGWWSDLEEPGGRWMMSTTCGSTMASAAEGVAVTERKPVHRLRRGEERPVGAEQQLVVDAELDRASSAL